MCSPAQTQHFEIRGRRVSLPPSRWYEVVVGLVVLSVAALIDYATHHIRAFEDDDPRGFALQVANPAALIVAKTIKIAERDQDSR